MRRWASGGTEAKAFSIPSCLGKSGVCASGRREGKREGGMPLTCTNKIVSDGILPVNFIDGRGRTRTYGYGIFPATLITTLFLNLNYIFMVSILREMQCQQYSDCILALFSRHTLSPHIGRGKKKEKVDITAKKKIKKKVPPVDKNSN